MHLKSLTVDGGVERPEPGCHIGGIRTEIVTCGCGAKYELEKHKLITRDKDSLECSFCGATLIEWNGAVMYSKRLIEAPEGSPSA
ncbi:MAG: hypothetical protein ACJ8ER_05715 [Allosphingosinicella sp.]